MRNWKAPTISKLSLSAMTRYPLYKTTGFSLVFAWCTLMFYNAGLSFPSIDIFALTHSHIASSISYVVTSIFLAVFAYRISPLYGKRDATIVCGIIASAATITVGLVNSKILDSAWLNIAVFACGSCAAILEIAWGELYAIHGAKGTAILLALSIVAGYVLYYAMSFLPAEAMMLISALLPLAGSFLLREKEANPDAEKPKLIWREAAFNLPLRLCVTGMLLFCIYGIARSGGMMAASELSGDFSRLLTLLIFVLPVAIATLLALLLKDRNINAGFYGIIALGVLAALTLGISEFSFSIALSGLSAELLYYLTWFIIIDKTIQQRGNVLLALAILHVFRALGILIGQLVGEAFYIDTAATTIIMLVFLVVTALTGLGSTSMIITLSEPSQEVLGIPKTSIIALAERYSLTPREQEIVELWCLGHTSSFIQKTLSISHNTTKTHISHIYQKTNVTTREELIALTMNLE